MIAEIIVTSDNESARMRQKCNPTLFSITNLLQTTGGGHCSNRNSLNQQQQQQQQREQQQKTMLFAEEEKRSADNDNDAPAAAPLLDDNDDDVDEADDDGSTRTMEEKDDSRSLSPYFLEGFSRVKEEGKDEDEEEEEDRKGGDQSSRAASLSPSYACDLDNSGAAAAQPLQPLSNTKVDMFCQLPQPFAALMAATLHQQKQQQQLQKSNSNINNGEFMAHLTPAQRLQFAAAATAAAAAAAATTTVKPRFHFSMSNAPHPLQSERNERGSQFPQEAFSVFYTAFNSNNNNKIAPHLQQHHQQQQAVAAHQQFLRYQQQFLLPQRQTAVTQQQQQQQQQLQKQQQQQQGAGQQHKRKGGQIRFTNEQTDALEETFDAHKYLTNNQRKKMAKSLALSERQVKTWFQNRRAKWRRIRKDGEEEDDERERYQMMFADDDVMAAAAAAAAVAAASTSTATASSASSFTTSSGFIDASVGGSGNASPEDSFNANQSIPVQLALGQDQSDTMAAAIAAMMRRQQQQRLPSAQLFPQAATNASPIAAAYATFAAAAANFQKQKGTS